jgi:hypothetical protein
MTPQKNKTQNPVLKIKELLHLPIAFKQVKPVRGDPRFLEKTGVTLMASETMVYDCGRYYRGGSKDMTFGLNVIQKDKNVWFEILVLNKDKVKWSVNDLSSFIAFLRSN